MRVELEFMFLKALKGISPGDPAAPRADEDPPLERGVFLVPVVTWTNRETAGVPAAHRESTY